MKGSFSKDCLTVKAWNGIMTASPTRVIGKKAFTMVEENYSLLLEKLIKVTSTRGRKKAMELNQVKKTKLCILVSGCKMTSAAMVVSTKMEF
jgi:hypothetical protein